MITAYWFVQSGRAIQHVKENIFTAEGGVRRGIPNVLVVLTDGRSQDDVNKVSKEMQMEGQNCSVCALMGFFWSCWESPEIQFGVQVFSVTSLGLLRNTFLVFSFLSPIFVSFSWDITQNEARAQQGVLMRKLNNFTLKFIHIWRFIFHIFVR